MSRPLHLPHCIPSSVLADGIDWYAPGKPKQRGTPAKVRKSKAANEYFAKRFAAKADYRENLTYSYKVLLARELAATAAVTRGGER